MKYAQTSTIIYNIPYWTNFVQYIVVVKRYYNEHTSYILMAINIYFQTTYVHITLLPKMSESGDGQNTCVIKHLESDVR